MGLTFAEGTEGADVAALVYSDPGPETEARSLS